MSDSIRDLLGVVVACSRHNRKLDGEFEYEEVDCRRPMDWMVFGKESLSNTLRPTWELIHNPRSEAVKNCYVINKNAVFGGGARQGVQAQLKNGTFTSGITGSNHVPNSLPGEDVIEFKLVNRWAKEAAGPLTAKPWFAYCRLTQDGRVALGLPPQEAA